MNNILGFALPTNSPRVMKEILIPSLPNALALRDVCTWLINFQPPYTQKEIREVVTTFENYGFKVRYTYTEYDMKEAYSGYVPVIKMRNDAARLMLDAHIYALIDDDMAFKSGTELVDKSGGEQYLDAVRYMLEFEKCGIILFRNRRRVVPVHTIKPVPITEPYYTGRGMFLKRVDHCLVAPLDSEWVLGGDEENLVAGARLNLGYYPAEVHSTRVYHHEHRRKLKVEGNKIYHWIAPEVLENNSTKYIRDNYNPEFKGSKGIIGGTDDPNIVLYEDYLEAGGLGITPRILEKYSMDFSSISVQDNLSRIKELTNN